MSNRVMAATAPASRPTKMEELASNDAPNSAPAAPTTPAKNDEEAAIVPNNTIECIICLDTLTRSSRAPQRCTHNVCKDCFSKYLTVAINDSCIGFPRCPEQNCSIAASDELISASVDRQVAARMRQLRGLHPARAKDGRRMWCVAPGCFEPLPPPIVEVPNDAEANAPNAPNNITGHMFLRNYDPNNNNNTLPPPAPPQSECGKCGASACLRCGSASHPGTTCSVPTTCLRQQRMYALYAVNRIAPCEQCGTHVERNGGCSQMVCGVCGHSFTFRPFTSVRQVQESLAMSAGIVPPPPTAPRRTEVLGRLMALHRGGPDADLFGDPLRGLDRYARRGALGIPRFHRRRATDLVARQAAERANTAAARNMVANGRRTPQQPAPPLPQPPQIAPAHPNGRPLRINRGPRRTPRATAYDYVSDEDLEYYDQDFDLMDLDNPYHMPPPPPPGVRRPAGPARGAANRATTLDPYAQLAGGAPQPTYDEGQLGQMRRLMAQQQRMMQFQAQRMEAAAARNMERGLGHGYYMGEENGRDEFGVNELWRDANGYAGDGPAGRQRLRMERERLEMADGGYGGPRRRASTGAAGGAGGGGVRRVGLLDPATRPVLRRRTLSDLEGATMPPPPIRRRTSADGSGMVVSRTPPGMGGSGRTVRFAGGTAGDEARLRRREAVRREMSRRRVDPARRFPEPEL